MSIDGRDLTYRLAVSSTEDVFSVETTDNPITVLTQILTDRGIPVSRIHFAPKETPEGAAPAPVVFHAAKDWEPDTSWLTIANEICAMIGYYRVHADDQGRVGSRPIRDRASASADVTYASGPGSMIVGDVTEDAPPMTSFANVVRVIGPDIPATSEPPDTGSPTPATGRTVRVTERLRLRESAGLSAPILLVMAVGTAAVVTGASQSANGYTWWPITATIPGLGQRSGWSAGNWLETVTNNPDPVTQPEKVKTRIEAIARNDDPASPTSTVSLGMEIVRVEKPNGIETQAQAEEQARNLLQASLSRYRKITLSTVPDPRRSLYELYALDVRRRNTVLVDGTWLAEGWELPFGPGSMRHTLYRTDPWQRSEALG
jgi:hypothetical protein